MYLQLKCNEVKLRYISCNSTMRELNPCVSGSYYGNLRHISFRVLNVACRFLTVLGQLHLTACYCIPYITIGVDSWASPQKEGKWAVGPQC